MANPFQMEYEHCQQKGHPNSEGVTGLLHWNECHEYADSICPQHDSAEMCLPQTLVRPSRPQAITGGKPSVLSLPIPRALPRSEY